MSNQHEHDKDKEIVNNVSNLLKKYHVRPELLGYDYMLYGLCYCLKYDKDLKNLNNSLYPTIAKRFNTTIYRVERCIRTAIGSTSWSDTYIQIASDYRKVTNSLFLSILLNELR